MKKINIYDYIALGLILALTALMAYRWEIFPLPVDIYYHLSVMKGFDLAGGIVTHDFWNFAPSGRVHLYPPFLHIVMLFMYKVGMSQLLIGKLISFVMYPLSLVTLWLSTKKIFGSKVAFYSTMILAAPFVHFRIQGTMNTAALALGLALLVFYAVERGKLRTGAVLLTICLYSHMSIGHLVSLTFILYGLLNWRRMKTVLIIVGLSYLFYLPWGIHFILNLGSLNPTGIQIAPQLYIHWLYGVLAAIGIIICLVKRREHLFPLAFLIGLLPMFFSYPMRFMEGHSLIPLSMLGGFTLSAADEALSSLAARVRKMLRPVAEAVFLAGLLVIVNLADPIMLIILVSPSGRQTIMMNEKTTLDRLIAYDRSIFTSPNQVSKRVLETAKWIEGNTREDDIFYIDNFYIGGLITSLTGRAQSWGMLHEVRPKGRQLQPEEASLVVQTLRPGRDYPGFELAWQFEGISIYMRSDGANRLYSVISKPVLPWWAAFILTGGGCLAILYDVFLPGIGKKDKKDKKPKKQR
jgi:hypothetical protein